jgi:ankyrin repeat protein
MLSLDQKRFLFEFFHEFETDPVYKNAGGLEDFFFYASNERLLKFLEGARDAEFEVDPETFRTLKAAESSLSDVEARASLIVDENIMKFISKIEEIHEERENYSNHLLNAIQQKDAYRVEKLVSEMADVNYIYENGSTPLHEAQSINVANILIANGANINARDNEGNTPLHNAQSLQVAYLLIANGADINARDNKGNTPLHVAILKGNANIVRTLLEDEKKDLNAKNNKNETIMHVAINEGQGEITNLLIREGAFDMLSQSEKVELILLAANRGNIDLVKELKQRSGKLSPEQITSLNDELCKVSNVQDKERAMALIAAGAEINEKTFNSVIKSGCNLNIEDKNGVTPLSWAVKQNDKVIVEQLINNLGADINAKNKEGNTALHEAIKQGSIGMVSLLKEKGADPSIKNNDNKSPHDIAKESNIMAMRHILGSKKLTELGKIQVDKNQPKKLFADMVKDSVKSIISLN